MTSYEERQEAKRGRLRKAAERRRQASGELYEGAKQMFDAIPFGQPILVGHYSEKSDRAYRGRANRKMDKSVELSKEADQLEARAESVGTGGISSDDPEAIAKLEEKLLRLEEGHALMVEQNREARTNGQPKPWPGYQLTNSNANIRRIKERIASLEHRRAAPPMEAKRGNGWTMYEDKEANRIVIRFDERISADLVKSLRSYGFLWSPTRKEWVRKAVNSRFAIDRAYQILSAL